METDKQKIEEFINTAEEILDEDFRKALQLFMEKRINVNSISEMDMDFRGMMSKMTYMQRESIVFHEFMIDSFREIIIAALGKGNIGAMKVMHLMLSAWISRGKMEGLITDLSKMH